MSRLRDVIRQQEDRKDQCINLIASENAISSEVRSVEASTLESRYIMGDFPNNAELRRIVQRTKELCSRPFHARYVNVTPLSGMNCMQLVFATLRDRKGSLYTIDPNNGGHISTKQISSLFGIQSQDIPYTVQNEIDLPQLERRFAWHAPSAVYLDQTLILFYPDIAGLKRVTAKYDVPVIFDGSHPMGLIGSGAFPNALDDRADILNGSTHKTLFGPQKGIVLTNDPVLGHKIDAQSKEFISSSHTGHVLALYVACLELEQFGPEYARQIICNAKRLGQELHLRGVQVLFADKDYTDTHQLWIDTGLVDAQDAFNRLSNAHINVNAMRIPTLRAPGLRLGTAEITRRGLKEQDMSLIADLIADVLLEKRSEGKIRNDVIRLAQSCNELSFVFHRDSQTRQPFRRNSDFRGETKRSLRTPHVRN